MCFILLQIITLSRQRGAPHKKSRKEIVLMLQGRHNVSEQQRGEGFCEITQWKKSLFKDVVLVLKLMTIELMLGVLEQAGEINCFMVYYY